MRRIPRSVAFPVAAVVTVFAIAGYLALRPPFKENGISGHSESGPGVYAFAFPPFDNASLSRVTVIGLSIDEVPPGVTVLGYRLVDLGADKRGYKTFWSAAGQSFDFRSNPLFTSDQPLTVTPFSAHRKFAMVEIRVTGEPTGELSGCAVHYRSLGFDRTQHLSCRQGF